MSGVKGKSGRKRNVRNIQEFYNRQFDLRSTLLIEKLLEKALDGDKESLFYCFDRRIGKPKATTELEIPGVELLPPGVVMKIIQIVDERKQLKGGQNGQEGTSEVEEAETA